MGLVYSHAWSLWWWRYTGSNTNANSLRTTVAELPSADPDVLSMRATDVAALRAQALRLGVPRAQPLELIVSGNPRRKNQKGLRLHQWNGFLPMWSLCRAGGDSLTCSPEFTLLLLAGNIRRIVGHGMSDWQYTVIVAELGCELCGTYSKRNTVRGFANRTQPLSSLGQMMQCVGRMAHEYGAQRMREAVTWVIEDLHSPMETALYLMLCLPASHGGMCLPRPFANYAIGVPKSLWPKTGRHRMVADLCWPERLLIAEYDSDEDHKGREREDQERRELAQDLGYRVVTFCARDVMDAGRFAIKAQSLAAYLGVGLPEGEKFEKMRAALHHMLVHHERWV